MDLKLLSIDNRNAFIEENKGFIYRAAQNVCKRSLNWQNDDELSIALIAFNNACDTFESGRGNFYSYVGIIIRNALIDHFRKSKYVPVLEFEDEDGSIEYLDTKSSISEYEKALENKTRNEEIISFSQELKKYKLSFDVLVDSSPSHIDTRNSLLNLAFLCTRESSIIEYIKEKKLLPVKEIVLLGNVNRKFVEKWRRYLMTLILILTSRNYPHIRSYLNIKAGEKIG